MASNILGNSAFLGGVTQDDLNNYLPLSGGIMSGNLVIERQFPMVTLNETTNGNVGRVISGTHSVQLRVQNNSDSSNNRQIVVFDSNSQTLVNSVKLVDTINGTGRNYNLHGDHNLTYALQKMFPSTATPTYIPVFGSGWESRGYTTVENLASALGGRVELVTYIGTGTYGESNPCSVTFSFAPKLIMMIGSALHNSSSSYPDGWFSAVTPDYFNHIACEYLTTSYQQYLGFIESSYEEKCYGKKSSNGKTIYWYTTGSWQYNDAKRKYYVLGIA